MFEHDYEVTVTYTCEQMVDVRAESTEEAVEKAFAAIEFNEDCRYLNVSAEINDIV